MMRALAAGDRVLGLRPVLRNIGMRDDNGRAIKDSPVKVIGKSGTLNFVSGLAGFIEPPSGRDLVFAIFSADAARREAVPMGDREDPPGEGAWVKRAHLLQARLIKRWAGMV
jgi:D-alanyl-D-alanine carboxypeptidase/D-alanyl-D-alanine-endopeptidase (penicillin-binding protein 4)